MLRNGCLGLVVLSLAACDPGSAPAVDCDTEPPAQWELPSRIREEIGETIATVNGFPIGHNEFLQIAGRRLRASDAGALSVEDRQAVVDELAEQKRLYLEARRKGYDKDPKVQRLMVQLLLQEEVYGDIKSADIQDDELRAFYQEHHDEFVIPEKIRLRRILIKADPVRSSEAAQAMAYAAYERVRTAPETFGRVASEVSEGPYRGRSGDLGLVGREPRPGVPNEVIERGFILPTGGISEPFLAGDGWNVVMVADRRERVERTFEQMRGAVVRRVKAEKHQQSYQSYVAEHMRDTKVAVFTDKLDNVRMAGPPKMPMEVDDGAEDDDK